MKLSIVMPVFNGGKSLASAVESLFAQDFTDWELVMVDDGSTDESPSIEESLSRRDKRIRVVRQPNGGVSIARNRGLDEACGEWVAWLDQDDAYLSGALAKIVEMTNAHPGCGCLQFPYVEMQPDGPGTPCIPPAYSMFGGREYSGLEAFDILFARRNVGGMNWQPWRFIYRRDSVPRFRAGVIHEDLDVLPLHLAGLPRVFISKDPVYAYRPPRSGSATAGFTPRRVRDILDVTGNVYAKLDKMAIQPGTLRGFRATLAYNLFGFYLATPDFSEPDRSELMDAFVEHGDWLLPVGSPRGTAWLKRLVLRLMGIRLAAIGVGLVRRFRKSHERMKR